MFDKYDIVANVQKATCMSAKDRCSSLPFSRVKKHNGTAQLGLYCIRSATGRLVFVPPPTFFFIPQIMNILNKEYGAQPD